MRPTTKFSKLSAHQRDELLSFLKYGEARPYSRAFAVLLSDHGYRCSDIAHLLERDAGTVRRWIDWYERAALDGLYDLPRSGRPRLGSRFLCRRLRTLLATPKSWTVGRLRHATRTTVSCATLRRRLHEIAAWRRPRLVAKGDPNAARIWKGLRKTIAKLPNGAVLLAEDEAHIDHLAMLRSTWIPHGQRFEVMTPGANKRRSIFGAVNIASGHWLYAISKKANSTTFIAFLEQTLAAYQHAPCIAILVDNVIIHSSKMVRSWLEEHPQVRLLYGARYSPHQNPVERVWNPLKHHIANTSPPTMQGRVLQVHAHFRAQTDQDMFKTAASYSAPWLPKRYVQNLCKAA